MNNRYYAGFLTLLTALFLYVAAPVQAQDYETTIDVPDGGEYEIEFLGVTGNGDGTYTWRYRVTELSGKDLSNWELELCPDTAPVDWSPEADDSGVEEVESKAGSIKWNLKDDYDNDGSESGDSRIFSFTLSSEYDLEQTSVGVTVKTGGRTKTGSGNIFGPSLDCENNICSVTTLGEDIVDQEARTVENQMHDPEGIREFEFVKLENFEVASITDGSGNDLTDGADEFDRSGNVWTWQGTDDLPTTVAFKLEATAKEAVYFLHVENGCEATAYIDPPFDFAPFEARAFIDGNYPNPFRTQTTVQFHLEEPAPTTLTVYDVMGRRVATLVEESLQAGSHEAVWDGRASDGSTLASGVYFVRLEAGDKVQTRRITLVK